MNSIAFLMISFALALSQSEAALLNCKFNNINLGYGCTSFDVFRTYDNVTMFSGRHVRKFEKAPVVYFLIPARSKTIFVPLKICSVFSEMKTIMFQGNSIASIKREVFENCIKVTNVAISTSLIDWIPEDTFDDLTSLGFLNLSGNKLKYLPSKLLDKNPKLHTFHASQNELKIIEIQFASSVSSVFLQNNTCVSQTVNNANEVTTLNDFLNDNCASSKQKSCKAELKAFEMTNNEKSKKIAQLERDYVELSKKLEKLEGENKNLETEKNSLNDLIKTNKILLEQQQQENENYKQQISAFSASVVSLKKQLEYHEGVKLDLEREKIEWNQKLINHQEAVQSFNETANNLKEINDFLMADVLNLTQTIIERDSQLQNLTANNDLLNLKVVELQETLTMMTTENPEENELYIELATNLTSCLEKIYELELVTVGNSDNSATVIMQTTFVTQPSDDINVMTSPVTRLEETTGTSEGDASLGEILSVLTSTENEDNVKQPNEINTRTTDDDEDEEDDYDDEAPSTKSSQTQQTIEDLCKSSTVVNSLQEQLSKLKNNLTLAENRWLISKTATRNIEKHESAVENTEVNKIKVRELESKINSIETLAISLAFVLAGAIVTLFVLSLKLIRKQQKFSTVTSGMELNSQDEYRTRASTSSLET